MSGMGGGMPIAQMVQGSTGLTQVGIGHAMSWQAKKLYDKYKKIADGIGDDPEQRGYLNRLAMQERLYRSGGDTGTAYANRLAGNAGAQAQANIARAGGGQGLVQNLLSSQAVTQRQYGANMAQTTDRADNMLGLRGQLINMMAQRRYDLQRYKRDREMALWAQKKQLSNNLISSGMSQFNQSMSAWSGSQGNNDFGGMDVKSAEAGTGAGTGAAPAGTNRAAPAGTNRAATAGDYGNVNYQQASDIAPTPYNTYR